MCLHITLDNTAAALLIPMHSQLEDSLIPDASTQSPLRFLESFEDLSGVTFDFRFRVKGMTAEQRSRTITHRQVKTTIDRLTASARLLLSYTHVLNWSKFHALENSRLSLKQAYKEHKEAVRDQRAQSRGEKTAEEAELTEAARGVEGTERSEAMVGSLYHP